MTIVEITTKVTHKSLMNKTKSELAYKVLELMDEKERADRLEAMIDRMSEKLADCTLEIWPLYDLSQQIEICGASIELTKAVTMAGDIRHRLMKALDIKQMPNKKVTE